MIIIEKWKKAGLVASYVVLAVIGFAAIMSAVTAMFDVLDLGDKEYITAFIGLTGAIIGGFITLVGVQLTIRANEKVKEKEGLPQSIFHLENSQDLLQEIITNYLMFPYRYSGHKSFLALKNDSYIEFTDEFEKLAVTVFETLRNEMIFVDSETYKKMLNTKKKLSQLRNTIPHLQLEASEFVERMINRHTNMRWDPNEEIVEERHLIEEKLDEESEILREKIKDIFTDLQMFLAEKHNDLVKRLDY